MSQSNGKMNNTTFGRPLKEPILGAHYSLPPRALATKVPIPDHSMSIIPVYKHLKMYQVESIELPTLEKCIIDAKNKLQKFWINKLLNEVLIVISVCAIKE